MRRQRGGGAEDRAEQPPLLVILDWMLPGMNGLEICRKLKSQSATQAVQQNCSDGPPAKP